MRQAAHRVFEPDQIFRRRQVAQRVAHLGEALLEIGQRSGIAAGLPAAADPLGQRADFGFERLDRLARHRVLQRAADLGEIAAQRGERVLVGLMQRGNLGGDLAKLVLERRQILASAPAQAPAHACRARMPRVPPPSSARWRAEISAAQFGPLGAGGGGGGGRREARAIIMARRCASIGGAARLGDNLVEPAVEPRQRFADAVRGIVVAVPRRRPPLIGLREAVEIARQIVETIVDRGEIVADRLLVVSVVAM